MKYLITGGAGFIGSHLSELIVKDGHDITIIDDLSTGRKSNLEKLFKKQSINMVFDSIDNVELVDELVSDSDFVIHLAAAVGVKLIIDKPVHTLKTNIRGTEVILDAALKYEKPVFLASTSEVYGKLKTQPFSEDSDCLYGPTTKYRWSYAVSKAVDEYLGLAYAIENSLEIIIGRFFNTVGPRQIGHYGMVLPRFIKAALLNKDLIVYGDGEQRRCFGYVKEAAKAVYLLTKSKSNYGEIFNIGNNIEISINELASKVIEHTNSNSRIIYKPFGEVYGEGFEDMDRRIPDTNKLNKSINFSFQKSIDDIIEKTAQYIKKEIS